MKDLEPEAKSKRRIDTFVYGAVALGVVGIDVKPWFEAQSEISITKAKADAEIYVIREKLVLEREKNKLSPELQNSLKLLQDQVGELKIDIEGLKENSHKPN
jgi:hypothetical protein